MAKGFKQEYLIGIKKNYIAGMKPISITKLFNISPQKVNHWIHHAIILYRRRRMKLTRNKRNITIK